MTHAFQCMQVLLYSVMQLTKLFSSSVLEWSGFQYGFDVGLMNQSWSIVSGLETLDCFVVIVARLGQTFNRGFG